MKKGETRTIVIVAISYFLPAKRLLDRRGRDRKYFSEKFNRGQGQVGGLLCYGSVTDCYLFLSKSVKKRHIRNT